MVSHIYICKNGHWNRSKTNDFGRLICWACGQPILSVVAKNSGRTLRGERVGSPEQAPPGGARPTVQRSSSQPGSVARIAIPLAALALVAFAVSQYPKSSANPPSPAPASQPAKTVAAPRVAPAPPPSTPASPQQPAAPSYPPADTLIRTAAPPPAIVPLVPYVPPPAIVQYVVACVALEKAKCVAEPRCQWQAVCYLDKRKRQVCDGTGFCGDRKGDAAAETPRTPAAKPALAVPPTSTIEKTRRRNAIAPFAIETSPGEDYLVKLANANDPKDQIMIYVRGGQTYSTKVPLGTYHMRAATGREWYGKQDLFGPDTRFFRLRTKGKTADMQVFNFRRQGNKIIGMTLSFKGVVGGNMEQEKISRGDF
jgi:hypothetical protein